MSTVNRSIVTGVFPEVVQAKQAMADLQNAGFTDDQIRYSVHKGGAGILDALQGLGLAQDEADFYNSEFMAGRTVVTVNTPDQQQAAYDILMRNGAYDWRSRMGQTGTAGATAAAAGTYAQTAPTDYDTEEGRRLRLREEQLTAQKQQVQAGEVRLHKDVIAEERTLNVPVSHEEVYIEHRPASGVVPSDTPIGQDETINVPVSAEQVQVSKQTVDTGEVNIGKRVVQENQQVTDTVRREEARVEQAGDVNVQGNIDNTTTTNP